MEVAGTDRGLLTQCFLPEHPSGYLEILGKSEGLVAHPGARLHAWREAEREVSTMKGYLCH